MQLTMPGVPLAGGRLVGRGWADIPGHTGGDSLTPEALAVLLTPRPAGSIDDESTLGGWDFVFTPDIQPADITGPDAGAATGEGLNGPWAQALDAAASNAVSWLDEHATFTRAGYNGCRQVDTRGLLAAMLTHRDDTAGGRLHTHVVISHHVCDTSGRWTRLDISALFRSFDALTQRYRTRLARRSDTRQHGEATTPGTTDDRAALLRRLATEVIDRVSAERAVWDTHHIRAHVEQLLLDAPVPLAELDATADTLVETVLAPPLSQSITPAAPLAEPPELCRRDGGSVFLDAGTEQYSSATIVDAEALLARYGARHDGWAPPSRYPPHPTRPIVPDTGPRLQVLPVSYATGTESRAGHHADIWNTGGGNTVCVHAHPDPSIVASSSRNPALHPITQLHPLTGMRRRLENPYSDRDTAPGWVAQLGPRTLLIVLEAAAAGLPDLGALLRRVLGAGGSVKLVYDELSETHGSASGAIRDLLVAQCTRTMARA